jgi:hypothetical protein
MDGRFGHPVPDPTTEHPFGGSFGHPVPDPTT